MDVYTGPKTLISAETYCQNTVFINIATCSITTIFVILRPSENLWKRAVTTCPNHYCRKANLLLDSTANMPPVLLSVCYCWAVAGPSCGYVHVTAPEQPAAWTRSFPDHADMGEWVSLSLRNNMTRDYGNTCVTERTLRFCSYTQMHTLLFIERILASLKKSRNSWALLELLLYSSCGLKLLKMSVALPTTQNAWAFLKCAVTLVKSTYKCYLFFLICLVSR